MIKFFVVSVLCAVQMWIFQNLLCLRCGCHTRNIMASVIKVGCMRCLCDKNTNIFNFVLGPLSMVKNLLVLFIKSGCMSCLCGINENILNFALSPLWMVYMKSFMVTVKKVGCIRLCWKVQVKIFLLSIKMSCFRCFCFVQSVSKFFSVLWIMKFWLRWLCLVNLLKLIHALCI